MFDNRIFNPDRLGTEREERTLEYEGWAILARIRAQNFVQAVQWAKHTFTDDGTMFNEENNRYFLSYGSDSRAVEIIPDKIKYKDTYSGKLETYNLILEAEFLGFKRSGENKHQELFEKVLSKIPEGRGFLIKEGKRFEK